MRTHSAKAAGVSSAPHVPKSAHNATVRLHNINCERTGKQNLQRHTRMFKASKQDYETVISSTRIKNR
jgi:hypothetical protein